MSLNLIEILTKPKIQMTMVDDLVIAGWLLLILFIGLVIIKVPNFCILGMKCIKAKMVVRLGLKSRLIPQSITLHN